MDELRAAHQDIRPISIGLLNLMPLKEDTELPTDTECYGKNGYVDSEGIYIQKEKQEEIKEIQEEKGDKDNADSSTK